MGETNNELLNIIRDCCAHIPAKDVRLNAWTNINTLAQRFGLPTRNIPPQGITEKAEEGLPPKPGPNYYWDDYEWVRCG